MPFRKFRLAKQFEKNWSRIFRDIYQARVKRKAKTFYYPDVLKGKNVTIYDANDPDFPRKTTKDPVVTDHPALHVKQIEEHSLYKSKACFLFDGTEVMSDGLNQALELTKCVPRFSLPEDTMKSVQSLKYPENHEEMIQRLILHSQTWDSTMEKLPKRFDPVLFWIHHPRVYGIPNLKKCQILFDNLYRHCFTFAGQLNHLRELRFLKEKYFNGTISHRENNIVCYKFKPNITTFAPTPLTPRMSKEEVGNTRNESVPDVSPLSIFMDLPTNNIYDFQPCFPGSVSWSNTNVHTVMISHDQDQKYPWTTNELLANALLHCFGASLAVAKRKYGNNFNGELDEPVVTQLIQLNGGPFSFDFVVFQLNSLDLSSTSGIKNVAWLDGDNKLFTAGQFWETYENVQDYNDEVFRKFLAIIESK